MSADIPFDDIVYEQRLVAFVDVLGWSSAMAEAAHDPKRLGRFLVHLKRTESQVAAGDKFAENFKVPIEQSPLARGFEATQFSDCIVVSAPITNSASLYWQLEEQLRILCDVAAQSGFLLRGGVAAGLLFHRSNIVFGPALVAAHHLEEKIAVYPRIILSEELSRVFYGAKDGSPSSAKMRDKAWRTDDDGRLFFDYLRPLDALNDIERQKNWVPHFHFLATYKQLICDQISKNRSNERVLDKYLWTVDYFDALVSEYPGIFVPTVAIKHGNEYRAFQRDEWPARWQKR